MATVEGEARDSLFRDINGAKTQSLVREVNERLKEAGERGTSSAYAEDAICECANDECSERVSLSADEYEELRRHGARFAVAPTDEHVFPDFERVVAKHGRYWVVEKQDQAAAVAIKLDPRRRTKPSAWPRHEQDSPVR
jgi:hypothetical protein